MLERKALTFLPRGEVVLHEPLPPGAADGDLLAFQALLQMQGISLLAASRDVLLDVVSPDSREDSPEETTIRVASQVHLVAGHVLDDLWIVADLVPDVLRSVLWQMVPDPVADNNFSTGEAKLRLLKNRLDEGHAAVLLYRQPGVTYGIYQTRGYLQRSVMYWWRSFLLRSLRINASFP